MPMLVKFYQRHPENPENPFHPDSDKLELKCVTSIIKFENSPILIILIPTKCHKTPGSVLIKWVAHCNLVNSIIIELKLISKKASS